MKFTKTSLADAFLIEPKVFRDERGFFMESYNKRIFLEQGITAEFVQDNHSLSLKKGVLRGLHFQLPPHAQAKIIRVTKGRIFDVIVDLRRESPTFKKWEGFELDSKNYKMLFVPRGFAHGFVTLEENTEIIYKVDALYNPESDYGIAWNDEEIGVAWPINEPQLSEKDSKLQKFSEFRNPF